MLNRDQLNHEDTYNWIGQAERLKYMGWQRYSGDNRLWYQFARAEAPDKVWCEVLAGDLPMFEVSK